MKPVFTMLVGIPGSGKTFYAENMGSGAIIHSSNKLRFELYGDENDREHNEELFIELHRRIREDLKNGNDVVYDATNVNKKRRIAFLREMTNITCRKCCVVVMTPYERCVELNRLRDRMVPELIIRNMLLNWQPPDYSEGWDSIEIYYNMDKDGDIRRWSFPVLFEGDCGIDNFPQENSHHSLTLGEHCRKANRYLKNKYPDKIDIQFAALLHDIGKIETKSYLNAKGENDGECHYYQHHCVSAYNSMFYFHYYNFPTWQIIYISNLIYYHMHPYMSWKSSEKAKMKDWMLLGDEMFNDILLLHEADVAAH